MGFWYFCMIYISICSNYFFQECMQIVMADSNNVYFGVEGMLFAFQGNRNSISLWSNGCTGLLTVHQKFGIS